MSDFTELTSLHQKSYGLDHSKHKPDPARCCVEVYGRERWASFSQCARKRGFGPEQAYCKQHDPAVVKAKRDASEAKYQASMKVSRDKWHLERHAPALLAALRQIADGDNDPRAVAADVLATFDKDAPK